MTEYERMKALLTRLDCQTGYLDAPGCSDNAPCRACRHEAKEAKWYAERRQLLNVLEQLLQLEELDKLDEHEPELHAAARAAIAKARGQ